MRKCIVEGCESSHTKDSRFCLTHALEASGGLFLARAMETGTMFDVSRPAPAETPQGLHDRIMARVHREQMEESES